MFKKVCIILAIVLLAQILGFSAVSQAQYWARAYIEPNRWDVAKCVRQVPLNNGDGYIVVGYSSGVDSDILAIKLNCFGIVEWKRRYDFGGTNEVAEDVVVIPNGGGPGIPHYLIVGHIDGDILTMRLNNLGFPSPFAIQYPLPGSVERAFSIEQTNTSGQYIVVGVSNWRSAGLNYDILAMVVDQSGLLVPPPPRVYDFWGGNNEFRPVSVCVRSSPDGYIVAGGTTPGFMGGTMDGIIMELNTGLGVNWVIQYVAPPGGHINFEDIDANLVGTGVTNVYEYLLTGYANFLIGTTPPDMLVMSLANNGTMGWARIYDGGANDYGQSIDVAFSGILGNYVVTGGTDSWFNTSGINFDLFVTKLDWQPNQLWTKVLHPDAPPFNPMDGDDWGFSIEAISGGVGGYIVAGPTNSLGTPDPDFLVAKLDQNGDIMPYPPLCTQETLFYEYQISVFDTIPDFLDSVIWLDPWEIEWWDCDTTIEDSLINWRIHLCGDVNGDDIINLGDVIYLVNYLFRSGPPPVSEWAADVNCDYVINVSDVVYLANYYFGKPGFGKLHCCE